MKRLLPISLILILTGMASGVIAAETEKVEATGQAAIIDGDKSMARDKAIDDALRKAVESTVGTLISSETITENYQLISDRIFSKAKGYVQKYRITDEREEDGVIIVEVRAEVASGAVNDDLDGLNTLMQRKGMPKVIIMIAEQNVGMANPEYWWGKSGPMAVSMRVAETTLMEEMQKKGFTFVDPEVFSGKVSIKMPVAMISDKQAVRVTKTSDAQIIIVGKAMAEDLGDLSSFEQKNMRSARADVIVRVINTDNGKIIATVQANSSCPGMTAQSAGKGALKKAAKKAAKELIKRVAKVWSDELSGSNSVRMVVTGFANRGQLNGFIKVLRNQVRSVKAVTEDQMSAGKAILTVQLAGETRAMATELEAKDFGGKFKLEVVKVSANAMTVKLLP